MWRNNRPENWNASRIVKATIVSDWVTTTECKLVEAGADAMLKAIWKLAKESPTGAFTFDSKVMNIYSNKEDK